MNWDQVFVRLSSRSPKDAALLNPNFRQLFKEAILFLEKEEEESNSNQNKEDDPLRISNRRLHALYRASTYALKVRNGREGVGFLIESDRIQGTHSLLLLLYYDQYLLHPIDFIPYTRNGSYYNKKVW